MKRFLSFCSLAALVLLGSVSCDPKSDTPSTVTFKTFDQVVPSYMKQALLGFVYHAQEMEAPQVAGLYAADPNQLVMVSGTAVSPPIAKSVWRFKYSKQEASGLINLQCKEKYDDGKGAILTSASINTTANIIGTGDNHFILYGACKLKNEEQETIISAIFKYLRHIEHQREWDIIYCAGGEWTDGGIKNHWHAIMQTTGTPVENLSTLTVFQAGNPDSYGNVVAGVARNFSSIFGSW